MGNNEILVQRDLHLARGNVLRIVDGRDVQVLVNQGCVWITQERDRRDRTICAGVSFGVDRQGHTLVQALQPSVVSLAAPRAERYARQIDILTHGTPLGATVYRSEPRFAGHLLEAWTALVAGLRRRPAPTL